jgi:hypothetical protein
MRLERTDAPEESGSTEGAHLRSSGGLEERGALVMLPDGGATTPCGLGTRNYGGGGGQSQEGEIVVRMIGWAHMGRLEVW